MRSMGPGPFAFVTRARWIRNMLLTTGLAALLAAFGPSTFALDGSAYTVEVLVGGVPLREYNTSNTTYIEALKGREYAVRLTNHTSERVGVALSVDGLNSIDAKTTTAREASKWILEPYASITIDGWQTSSHSARRFFFTSEKRSYGAWLGDTRNLGLIAAAFFREHRPAPIARIYPYSLPPRPYGRDGDDSSGRLREGKDQSARPESAPSVQGGTVQGGREAAGSGGPSNEAREPQNKEADRSAQRQSSEESRREKSLSSSLAATGIGRELDHPVERVVFNEEAVPAAILEVRYEYHDALVHLGVIPKPWRPCPEDPYARRERAQGFDNEGWAPDPYASRRR